MSGVTRPPEPATSILDAIEPVVLGEHARVSTRTLWIVSAVSVVVLVIAVVVAVWLNWQGPLEPIPVGRG